MDFDVEEVRAIRNATAVVKSTRASAQDREHSARVLAARGIDPSAPSAPPHPFMFRSTRYYPGTMDRETAKKRLAELEAKAPRFSR